MALAALAPGEGVWVFLKGLGAIPLVLDVEVQAQAIPCVRGPRATGKGGGACILGVQCCLELVIEDRGVEGVTLFHHPEIF